MPASPIQGHLATEIWVSGHLYAMRPLEVASEVLLEVLRLGCEEGGLETADGDGGGVLDDMVGYEVEGLSDSRVEDQSSECCSRASDL